MKEKSVKTVKSSESLLQRGVNYLLSPCDPANLGVFRFLFGLLMVVDIPQERGFASIHHSWEEDKCYFTLFSFLQPLSYEWMHVLYTVMFLAAIGVMVGCFYRLSCFTLMTCYWYIFFLDKAVWNNHSYLYGVISVLLLMTDCNRYWSIDGLISSNIRNRHIPKWNYFIFKFQIFLVYFYAGIKKLDRDWMTGYSMTGLSKQWVFDPFRSFLSNESIDFYLVHLSGLCYDLFVGFFLLFERTRPVGVFFSMMFHVMNSQMFSIGMFPYAMMASLVLFYSHEWPKKIVARLPSFVSIIMPLKGDAQPSSHCVYACDTEEKRSKATKPTCNKEAKWSHKFMLMLFGVHIGLQCFLPYSHFLTKGYNGWTEGLYGYSWDMMVHSWSTQHIRVKVVDQTNGKEVFIRPGAFISGGRRSHSRWSSHPDMIKQYIGCLAEKLSKHEEVNISEPAIYLDIWRSLNRRFQQRFVDPNVNIVKAPWSPFAHSPWVLPLLTDLSPWRQKMKQIEQEKRKSEMGNFTDIVFVADFPGLMLENFISDDLNTTLSVLSGRVSVEIDSQNYTLGEGEEIDLPSNVSHFVYTVSDTPACWMYAYINTTFYNNETLRQWLLHPETRPSRIKKQEKEKRPALLRFKEFMQEKYMLFYVSFWRSYQAIGRLAFGVDDDYNDGDEYDYNTNQSQGKDQSSDDKSMQESTQESPPNEDSSQDTDRQKRPSEKSEL